MIWNEHFKQQGQHAFLGASKYHWINYDTEKMLEVWNTAQAVAEGTALHKLASELIKHHKNMPKTPDAFNKFVNDAIGFQMRSEQVLYVSDNCFGTADAICYRDFTLRVHDLKTGNTPGHMEQLMVYAAMFCMEYKVDPRKIKIELRIYQYDGFESFVPDSEKIREIMKKIREFDILIEKEKEKREA